MRGKRHGSEWERYGQLNEEHVVMYREVGPRIFELRCLCGWKAVAPFGQEMAEEASEQHVTKASMGEIRGTLYGPV